MWQEIERKIRCLNSDQKVAGLVDSLTLIQTASEREIVQLVGDASRVVSPGSGIYLLKFIVSFSKKNFVFFRAIESILPGIVLFCYQVADNKDIVLLYVDGWRMMGENWCSASEKASLLIKMSTKGEDLGVLSKLVGRPMPHSLQEAEEGMEVAIDCLNILTSI